MTRRKLSILLAVTMTLGLEGKGVAQIAVAEEKKVFRPGESAGSLFGPTYKYEVRLRLSWGYLSVRMMETDKGLILALGHYAGDGKPMQSLQERTVTVYLHDRKGKKELPMRNVSGFLSSRQPLHESSSWKLTVELNGVRGGIKDDSFDVEYKQDWVEPKNDRADKSE